MNCSVCNSNLMRAKSGLRTDLNSTEIHKIDLWICPNKSCARYGGKDLSDPEVVERRKEEIIQSCDF